MATEELLCLSSSTLVQTLQQQKHVISQRAAVYGHSPKLRHHSNLFQQSAAVSQRHCGGGQLICDGTRAETRFRLSAKRTSPFKSAGASVQSTTGSRGVRISGSNAGYTQFISFSFTSPPVHHRVPSHFNWSLLSTDIISSSCGCCCSLITRIAVLPGETAML